MQRARMCRIEYYEAKWLGLVAAPNTLEPTTYFVGCEKNIRNFGDAEGQKQVCVHVHVHDLA